MIDLLNKSNVTVAINNHTPDQRLLRAPSSSNEPQIVADEVAYEALLQRLAKNLPGWAAGPWTDVYYEASSTAEQQAYYAYGAFGFTPEATPGFSGTQTFHPPYENVINNYLGIGTRYANQTMRGLYYDAFKAATEADLHSVLTGTAPAGAKLTLTQVDDARHLVGRVDDGPARRRSARSPTRSRRPSRCRRAARSSGTSTRPAARASTPRRTWTSPMTSSARRPTAPCWSARR